MKVKKLDQLNVLLDGALAAGLNEINSVQFGVANPQQYRDEARSQAIKNATEQANLLAKGFNVQLGPVYSINYNALPGAISNGNKKLWWGDEPLLLKTSRLMRLMNNRVLILMTKLMWYLN